MSPNIFLGWLAVTAVTLMATIAVTLSQPDLATVELANEPAFPTLRANPDAAKTIVVRTAEGPVTLERSGDGTWLTKEKDGYPAAAGKIRQLLVEMADMRLVERKTKRAEGFARLEVEDLEAEESKSRQVRVEAADGTVLAESLLGRSVSRYTGGRDKGTYIRRPGDEHAWLAGGGPEVQVGSVDWLKPDIVHLANETIDRIVIQPEDGEGYAVSRDAEGKDLLIEILPEDRKVKNGVLSRLASGLAFVELNDIAPKATYNKPETYPVARLTTEDGLEVTAQLYKQGEDTWAAFEARYIGEDEAGDEAGAAARKAAEEINARVGNWVYQIDDFIVERLTLPLEDLLEPIDKTS